MTTEQLKDVLQLCDARLADGTNEIPPGRHLTLHLSAGGVGLTIGKVTSLHEQGGQVRALTTKGETYVFSLADVFACAIEGQGERARKAGFV